MTEDEYERFFEQVANTKVPYKFKLHYTTDVPLAIKTLLYIPSQTSERMNMPQEESAVDLYCKKVLIKAKCGELLPNYLRFVKGVVDCEDLPLNVSRETYQDSSLVAKLRNIITRRVLKTLEDEARKDPAKYNTWYATFKGHIAEGTQTDTTNREVVYKLMRFAANYKKSSSDLISLEEYISKMKEGQKKIYFTNGSSYHAAMDTPFYEPFKDSDVPVLVLSNQLDEFCL